MGVGLAACLSRWVGGKPRGRMARVISVIAGDVFLGSDIISGYVHWQPEGRHPASSATVPASGDQAVPRGARLVGSLRGGGGTRSCRGPSYHVLGNLTTFSRTDRELCLGRALCGGEHSLEACPGSGHTDCISTIQSEQRWVCQLTLPSEQGPEAETIQPNFPHPPSPKV